MKPFIVLASLAPVTLEEAFKEYSDVVNSDIQIDLTDKPEVIDTMFSWTLLDKIFANMIHGEYRDAAPEEGSATDAILKKVCSDFSLNEEEPERDFTNIWTEPEYPHAPNTPWPKAKSSYSDFQVTKENKSRNYGPCIWHHGIFDGTQPPANGGLNDALSDCVLYTVRYHGKDWYHVVHDARSPCGFKTQASVFIQRHPFTTTLQVEMLKLTIKQYLVDNYSLKSDTFNDSIDAEVIFNGI